MTFALEHDVEKEAHVSACGAFRYWLSRKWDRGTESLLWIMLNPSTADATLDDPTIRRCMVFARREGFGGIDVVNLYAYRATDPMELRGAPDPIGPANDDTLLGAIGWHETAVAAWGEHPSREPAGRARVETVVRIAAAAGRRLMCLGTTKSGAPRHPLYVRADAELLRWGHR